MCNSHNPGSSPAGHAIASGPPLCLTPELRPEIIDAFFRPARHYVTSSCMTLFFSAKSRSMSGVRRLSQ